MSMNGSGVFVVNSSGQPVVANTLISATVFNAFTADVATALSTALYKDGQQTVTANIPMGGYKLTGLGDATTANDSVRFNGAAGTPTSLVLTNATGLPAAGVTGTALTLAGGTLTGALNDPISGVTSVKNYGALGDGVTDATAAFQSAVDSGYAIIVVPAGVYLFNGTVNITLPVRIVGAGIDFKMTGAGVCQIKTTSASNDFFTVNADNVIIEGIDLHGKGTRAGADNLGRGIAVGTVTRTVTDGAMTAASATLSSATAAFTSADVGKYVSVPGAYNGTSTSYITAYLSASTVTLNAAADNTVSGKTCVIAPIIVGFTARDMSASSHSIAIDFVNASNFTLDNCHLNGFHAVRVDSVAPDKGDSQVIGCHLSATAATDSSCIRWNASGGLRITNTKFLDCYNSMQIYWVKGTSGGPVISNCSFENMTDRCIAISGDSTKAMNGFVFTGNWVNGSTRQIDLGDTLTFSNVVITGNVFANGSATTMIYVGAAVSGFAISGNFIDGASVGGCTGISCAVGSANGLIDGNNIYRTVTPISGLVSTVVATGYTHTWTPVLTFTTPGDLSVAYTRQFGYYSRIGNQVTISGTIVTSTFTHTTASGNCIITGLPFSGKTATGIVQQGALLWEGITKANFTQTNVSLSSGSASLTLQMSGSAQTLATLTTAELPTGVQKTLHFSMTYLID